MALQGEVLWPNDVKRMLLGSRSELFFSIVEIIIIGAAFGGSLLRWCNFCVACCIRASAVSSLTEERTLASPLTQEPPQPAFSVGALDGQPSDFGAPAAGELIWPFRRSPSTQWMA